MVSPITHSKTFLVRAASRDGLGLRPNARHNAATAMSVGVSKKKGKCPPYDIELPVYGTKRADLIRINVFFGYQEHCVDGSSAWKREIRHSGRWPHACLVQNSNQWLRIVRED